MRGGSDMSCNIPRVIAIFATLSAALLLAGCGGVIDFHDHSGVECPPASAPNHCSGDIDP